MRIASGCATVAAMMMSAGIAQAAGTRFVMEGAYVGSDSWSTTIIATPGTPIRARLRVEFVGAETVTGLAGFNTQFTISNWESGDALGAWGTPAVLSSGFAGGILPTDATGNGRLAPFAAASTATLPTSSVASGVMTISGSTAGRIPVSQGPMANSGTYYNGSLSPQVFQLTFTPSFQAATSHVVTPFNIFNTTANNAKWYTGTNSTTINAAGVEIVPLVVTIPAPGGVVLCVIAMGAALRRRPGRR